MAKQANQCYHFAFTYNRKDISEADCIAEAPVLEKWLKDNTKNFIFQLERGEESGNLHFQGYLQLETKDRDTALAKKLRDAGFKMHVAPSSTAGKQALQDYAMKDDTRVQGPWTKKKVYRGQDLPKELWGWQKDVSVEIGSNPHGNSRNVNESMLYLTDQSLPRR